MQTPVQAPLSTPALSTVFSTSLSAWQQFALLGLVLLAALYVFYFRIWLMFAIGADLLFTLALAVTVASIAGPPLFDSAARTVVNHSPLPAALDRADARIARIAAMPQELIDDLLARIGVEVDEVPDAEPDETATTGADTLGGSSESLPAIEQGPFTETIRPSVDSLVALVLRGTALMGGTFMMLTALAMRSSSTTAIRLRDITARLDALEGGGG